MKTSFFATVVAAASIIVEAGFANRRASNWTIGQTVKTTSGPVTGHAALNKTEVSVYLGIPYAQPPVGDLRWEPPQKFLGTAPLNGSSFVRSSSKILDMMN